MGLFDKKFCDVCGEKIGFLGNRKLEDGNLCKHCAKKLSPWFSERRSSTVEAIKEQLAYREENRLAVADFNVTRTLGGSYKKLLLDEDHGKFLVAASRDLSEENPDVLDFSQVTGCRIDVDETRRELKWKNKEGKDISYSPPRYEYCYDFSAIINVNHPYFDEMELRLNDSQIVINQSSSSNGLFIRQVDPRKSVDYLEYESMGQEIVNALTQVRESVREEAAAANAPKKKMVCPYCGAPTLPDKGGHCEYCGSPIA